MKQALSTFTNLRSLDLADNFIGVGRAAKITALAGALAGLPQLRSLDVSGNSIPYGRLALPRAVEVIYGYLKKPTKGWWALMMV